MDFGLRGRAAIVTGASGGIGGATARGLAAEGASLLLVGRREEALLRVAEECLERWDVDTRVLVLDITGPDAADEAVAACLARFDRLDVLVNAAGSTGTRHMETLLDEDWQDQWEVHVMAPMRLMRAAGPHMARNHWGRIVNVASSAAKRPSASLDMSYSVTKAAQVSLSRSFADLLAASGVLVNAVAPGPVGGVMWESPGGLADQLAARDARSREEILEDLAARLPRGLLATEEEVAAVIVFLCSEAAANVVGAAWSVDGGAVPGIF